MEKNTWRHQLDQKRKTHFVGRLSECARFGEFLVDPIIRILHVHGPGGIGKTSLLLRWLDLAAEDGWAITVVDGNQLNPQPKTVEEMVLHHDALRRIIAFDAFDRIQPIENWLRHDLLPRLPQETRVVLSSRAPLSREFTTDPGWRGLMDSMELGGLSDEECLSYLCRRGVSESGIEAAIGFSRGHPLSLCLAADLALKAPGGELKPEQSPHIVRPLIDRIVGEAASSTAHLHALYAAALLNEIDQSSLARMVPSDDTRGVFDWLVDRSFVAISEHGVRLQELARDLLSADLKWRDPALRTALIDRATEYHLQSIGEAGETRASFLLGNLLFALRDEPGGELFQLRGGQNLFIDGANPRERVEALRLVATHEGSDSAEIAGFWQQRQPDNLRCIRDRGGVVRGLVQYVDLRGDTEDPEAYRQDPCIRQIRCYLDSAPLPAGKLARIVRFWMSAEHHQQASPVQTRIIVHVFQKVILARDVALWFSVHSPAEAWINRPDHIPRHFPELAFEVGRRRFAVFGADWRKTSRIDQIRRIVGMIRSLPNLPQHLEEKYDVLSKEQFVEAVKQAMRSFTHPDRLRNNPLLKSRLVAERSGRNGATIETLRSVITEAADSSFREAGRRRHSQVLELAYLKPAVKGLVAADELGMAFGTYRRHVTEALKLVTETLWQKEEKLATEWWSNPA